MNEIIDFLVTFIVIGGAVAWLITGVVGFIYYRDMFFPKRNDIEDETEE